MRSGCIVAGIVALVMVLVVLIVADISTYISTSAALERFREQAETFDVKIIRQSNSTPLIGDPHDVTFELLVKGKQIQGRCQSAAFSPMVCKLYGAGGE